MQRQPIIRQTVDRIERLRNHLHSIAAEGCDGSIDVECSLPTPDHAPCSVSSQPALDDASAAACSLCKGDCCLTGEERLAYLTADTIRGWRKRRLGATADDIVDEYLSFVPRKATADGCFYQAGTGCTLPREMRSDVCNRYFCDELRQFRAEAEAAVAAQARTGDGDADTAAVRAFFVVTLPSGRRQTRFHESPIA